MSTKDAAPEAGTSGHGYDINGDGGSITIGRGVATPQAPTTVGTVAATTVLPAGMRPVSEILQQVVWRLIIARERQQGRP